MSQVNTGADNVAVAGTMTRSRGCCPTGGLVYYDILSCDLRTVNIVNVFGALHTNMQSSLAFLMLRGGCWSQS